MSSVVLYMAIIIDIVTAILVIYVTRYWISVWREQDSSAAHGLAVSSLSFTCLFSVWILYQIWHISLHGHSRISLLMDIAILGYAMIQFFFVKGFFYRESKE